MTDSALTTKTDGLTLELVLADKAPSPFRLQDFIHYLDQTYCLENLAFYQSVIEYRTACHFFFGSLTTKEEEGTVRLSNGQQFGFQKQQHDLLNKEELLCVDYLMRQFDTIMNQFIHLNAPQEINIPADMKQQLLTCYYHLQSYHPFLLTPAYTSILELLRISAFIPFMTDPQRLATVIDLTTPALSISSSSASSSASTIASFSSRPTYYFSRSISHSPALTPSTSTPVTSPSLPWPPRRLKSSPSLNTDNAPLLPPPPMPQHRSSSLPPSVPPKEDDASSLLTPSLVDTTDDKTFLKKWTYAFRTRPPPRMGGWRQIHIQDTTLFNPVS